jgi:hypothetical protein
MGAVKAHLGTPLPAVVHVADEMTLEPVLAVRSGNGVSVKLSGLLACLAELVPQLMELELQRGELALGRIRCRASKLLDQGSKAAAVRDG